MKIKLFALLLAVTMLLALPSCGKNNSPASLYANALKSIEDAGGMEANVCAKISAEYAGETIDEDIDMTVKYNGESMYLLMEKSEVTYVDGTLYVKQGKNKFKQTISAEEFQSEYGSAFASLDFPALSEEVFADVALIDDGEHRSFTVKLDPSSMQSYANKIMSGLLGTDESTNKNKTIRISSMVLTPTFDKHDHITSIVVNLELIYDIQWVGEMKMHVDMNVTFVNPGTAPTITPPQDAESYETALEW